MIYTRNKQGFKKTTAKVQHSQARKNILSLIKETMGKTDTNASEKNDQNTQSKNIQQKGFPKKIQEFSIESKANVNHKIRQNTDLVPKICQSLYSTPSQNRSRINEHFKIHCYLNLEIIGSSPVSSNDAQLSRAHQQYSQILENKLSALEKQHQITVQKYEKIQKEYQKVTASQRNQQIFKDNCYEKFYHDARTNIILLTTQLIECKAILWPSENSPGKNTNIKKQRLQNINILLGKSEQLLTVYRKLASIKLQQGQTDLLKLQIAEFTLRKLEETCKYQQKTIDFLRKQNPSHNQMNQLRLLRHEINRISAENQSLMIKIKKISKQTITNTEKKSKDNSSIKKSPVKISEQQQIQSKKLQDKLQILEFSNKQQGQQIIRLNKIYNQEKDKSYKYKEEKQCLMQFLETQQNKNKQLLHKIDKLNIQIIEISQNNLRNNRITNENRHIILDSEKDIATTEELCKELQPYKRYFRLFKQIINQYEQKISNLQQKICQERLIKQKFMHWSSSVYQLLSEASKNTECEITAEKMQQHMEQLYKLDRKIQNSKIQRILRQIRSLSVGIANKQIKQMESELQEYVITLKSRNQIIQEVDLEDGSSVAMSDAFTDQDFDEDLPQKHQQFDIQYKK